MRKNNLTKVEKIKSNILYILIFLVGILFNLLTFSPSITYAQDNYQNFISSLENKEIVEIIIEGLSDETKLKMIDYLNVISVGEPFTYSKIKLFFRQLWNTGFFSDIIIDAKLTKDDKVILKIIFKELPKIGDVKIEGSSLIPVYTIEGKISFIKKGKAFRESDIQKDIKNIIELYKSRGIINTIVSYRMEKLEDGTYAIIFTIIEGKEVFIEKITINGAEKVPQNKILNAMETKQSTFYDIENSFNEDTLEKDKYNIIKFYRSLGYLDVEITDIRYDIRNVDEKGDILGYYIEIDVKEGEQYLFTGLEFEGNTVFSNEDLRKTITLKEGNPINESSLDVSKETIRYKYYEKGYLYANITPDIRKDVTNYTATDVMSIFESERVHIESIEVIGSDSRPYIIDRLYELEEGDVFSLSKLLKTRENLLNTGYFKAEGTIWQLSQGSAPGLIKLIWLVEEERLRSVLFNAQFDLSGGIAISADLQMVNFIGNGWDFSFKLEVAGFEEFSVSSSIGTGWLLNYVPISFKASASYSIGNVRVNPTLLGLTYTPEGYLGVTGGHGIGGTGVDLNGDGIIDNYDITLIDLNNDGVIDENDTVPIVDLDGDDKITDAEYKGWGISYTRQEINFAISGGYSFFRGFETYLGIQALFSVAQNPRFGNMAVVDFVSNPIDQIALSPEQVALIFGKDSLLARELTEGWIATLGITFGVSYNASKIGAMSSSGPLASGGWKTSLSTTFYLFGKQFIKIRFDISKYFTLIPWNEYQAPKLILALRAGIEMLGPLGESMISYSHITTSDKSRLDGYTELRGFSGIDRDLYGFGKWILQLELRGPFPGLEQFLWMVPFFIDLGNIGYNPRGYFAGLEFNPISTPVYDPWSGDILSETGSNTSGYKFSIGFGIRIINIIPLQFYFAWPFEITTDGVFRVVDKIGGTTNTTPWWPEFVITGYIYF